MARRMRTLGQGAMLGAALGLAWAGADLVAAWALGSVVPRSMQWLIVLLDVGVAAGIGGMVGAVQGRVAPSRLALAVVLGFGLCRIVAPPGAGAEAVYLCCAALAWVAGGRMLAREPAPVLAALHVAVLGAVVLVGFDLALDAVGRGTVRGIGVPVAVAGLPVAAIALDRASARILGGRGRRALAQAGVHMLALVVWGRPFALHPWVDPVVTAVPPPAGTPDVVVITLDTTRADHLSTYGYGRRTSPQLTAFAQDAVRYDQARSPAGWTLPGHASLMTGLFPASHGARLAGGMLGGESIDGRPNVAHPLADRHLTLAELLRDRGYETGAVVANFSYLYRDYGLAQGFGFYDDAPGLLLRVQPAVVRVARLFDPTLGAKPFRTAREVNRRALAWLDATDTRRPVFLFVNYMEPHQPWVAEAPHDVWARDVPGRWLLARTNLYTHTVGAVPARTIDFIRANYDGQIAAMDAALGELLAALRARGRYEQAMIVVTADHGELLGEHAQMGHMGRTLYEPLLRIPLVVKYPGADGPRGVVEADPVQLVDVVPTVARAAGVPVPDGTEGRSLDRGPRVIRAESGINPFLVAEYGAVYDRAMQVVYDGAYKLISTSRGERMLFDLTSDPEETQNLAPDHPGRVLALEQLLAKGQARQVARAQVR